MKPVEHKLVLQVFDENRLTRDDFLGMIELTLMNIPKEQAGRTIPTKQYILRPRRCVSLTNIKERLLYSFAIKNILFCFLQIKN